MAIYWNGDQANDPKSGIVLNAQNSNYVVLWSDGTQQIVPQFVVRAQNGWRVG